MQGCLDQLGTTEEPGQTLAVMRDRLGFMRQLVEDMFLMAKLEEKQVIFDADRVPLAPLAGRVCDGLRGGGGPPGGAADPGGAGPVHRLGG